VVQEATIGFFKAVRDFRPSRGKVFVTFAEMCITRQIITAIKTHTRQKHHPLNYARSLDEPLYDSGGTSLGDVIWEPSLQRHKMAAEDSIGAILGILKKHLTAFQYSVLTLWLQGYSYRNIAEQLSRREKAIDNGLTSIKEKVRNLRRRSVLPTKIFTD
jgi:RNA polymerase sporulation-specific sigma factor